MSTLAGEAFGVEPAPRPSARAGAAALAAETVDIALGETLTNAPVNWQVSIRTNTHLMWLACRAWARRRRRLISASRLIAAGIAPVIFSYHDDIDDKLAEAIGLLRTMR